MADVDQETTISANLGSTAEVYGNNDGDPESKTAIVASKKGITIEESGKVGNVFGGENTSGQNANENIVTVKGTVNGDAIGGQTNNNGSTNDNLVTVETTGSVAGNIYGGNSNDGPSNRNRVEIAGTVGGEIYGGDSNKGDVEDNKVTINGSTISKTSGAGRSVYGKAIHNIFTLNSGSVSYIAGGRSTYSTAELNETIINGGTAIMAMGADNKGGDVKENTLTITGGTIIAGAYGALIQTDGIGNATSNKVFISGGTINGLVIGGQADVGNAQGNIVNVSGGAINNDVIGGYSVNGNATGNTVNLYTLDGVTDYINGTIQGGKAGAGKNSADNTLNFIGTAKIPLATLDGDTIQTINVLSKDNHVKDITGHVENMNFYMPAGTAAGATMLTIDSAAGATNLIGTKYYVAAQSGLSLDVGEKVTLIKNGSETTLSQYLNTDSDLAVANDVDVTVPTGITKDTHYTFSIEKDVIDTNGNPHSIIATVRAKTTSTGGGGGGGSITITPATPTTSTTPTTPTTSTTTPTTPTVTPPATPEPITPAPSSEPTPLPQRTRSLTETRASMTTLLNGGSDFLIDKGMDEAESVAIDPEISVVYGRLVPFAVLGGGSLDIDSGAQVDLKTFYANLGLTKEIKNRQGSLYLGPIFEYGRGNYDSYMDNGVHGWGTGHYTGAGFFARQRNHDGLYYEGDVRIGRVTADYKGVLADGLYADYTTSGTYIAAHLGIGKIFPLNKKDTLDTYLKYFFSHTNSDDVNIHSNLDDENFHFDSVNSHRLRIGARYYHTLNEHSKLYAGLAYQYEFNGEARGSHNGLYTPAPSLKGGSGMAELGWQAKPSKDSPMTVDLGVTGWAGKQQGVMGRLKVSWSF